MTPASSISSAQKSPLTPRSFSGRGTGINKEKSSGQGPEPARNRATPFGNISQTYNLALPIDWEKPFETIAPYVIKR